MATRQNQPKDVQDQIFDFIFESQKKPPSRRPPPTNDEFVDILFDIGTQPALFPVTTAMEALTKSLIIDPLTIEDADSGVKVGPGLGLLGNPNDAIRAQLKLRESINSWQTVGGGIKSSLNGPLSSILAYSTGIGGKEAMKIGRLVAAEDEIKAFNIRGYDTKYKEKELDKYRREVSKTISKEFSSLYSMGDNKELDSLLYSLQRNLSKEERLRQTEEFFLQRGLSTLEATKISQRLWGDPNKKDSYGIYFGSTAKGDSIRESATTNAASVIAKASFENQTRAKIASLSNDIQKYKDEQDDISSRMLQLDTRLAGATPEEAQRIHREIKRLQGQLSRVEGSLDRTSQRMDSFSRRSFNSKGFNKLLKRSGGFGSSIANSVNVLRWVNKGGFGDLFLTGKWEFAEIGGPGASKGFAKQLSRVVERKEVKIGDKSYFYYGQANTAMGQLVGGLYYMHPANLIKSIVSGEIWLKMGHKSIERYGGKSIYAFLHSVSPGQWLKSKYFAKMTSVFQKVLPTGTAVKSAIRRILSKLVAINPVTGVIVNFLVNAIGREVLFVIYTTLFACVLGVIAFLMGGQLSRTKEVAGIQSEYMQNCIEQISQIVEENPFPNSETLCYYLTEDLGKDFLEDFNYSSPQQEDLSILWEQTSRYKENSFTD
jgi:hypothetical protein